MAWRVNATDVSGIIRDYDTDIGLEPFIQMASVLTDKVSAADTDSELTSDQLFEIERLLAAHFYDMIDHEVEEEETGDARGKYTGQFGMRLEATRHGQAAMMMDTSGYLRKVNSGNVKATFSWLGKPRSQQTDYVDRD